VDGITTTIHNHLETRYGPKYDKIVHILKHSDEVPGLTLATPSRSRAPKMTSSRRPVHYDAVFFQHQHWKYSKFCSSSISVNNYSLFLTFLQKEGDYAIDHATKMAIHELISSGNEKNETSPLQLVQSSFRNVSQVEYFHFVRIGPAVGELNQTKPDHGNTNNKKQS
jgi:hypothetical protein